jgi:hypothetical protein
VTVRKTEDPEVVRVRFASGIAELPPDTPAVLLPDGAILRWRAEPSRPPGSPGPLSALAPGDPVSVGRGAAWEQGVVLGRVIRPAGPERWIVDGDVRDYTCPDDAEREHGPLDRGDPLPPAPPPRDEIPLGDPLTRDQLAAALGCDPAQVEACAAALPRAAYLRLVSRAIAAREVTEPPDGQVQRHPRDH